MVRKAFFLPQTSCLMFCKWIVRTNMFRILYNSSYTNNFLGILRRRTNFLLLFCLKDFWRNAWKEKDTLRKGGLNPTGLQTLMLQRSLARVGLFSARKRLGFLYKIQINDNGITTLQGYHGPPTYFYPRAFVRAKVKVQVVPATARTRDEIYATPGWKLSAGATIIHGIRDDGVPRPPADYINCSEIEKM